MPVAASPDGPVPDAPVHAVKTDETITASKSLPITLFVLLLFAAQGKALVE
jgi:hypothetical protein